MPQKTSILFHREVQAVEFATYNLATILLILTRDGRVFRCSPRVLKAGTWQHSQVVTEFEFSHRLLGMRLLASCNDGVVAAGSTLLGPPQVLWLDNNDARKIPGLDHVQSPITSILFLFREKMAPALWRTVAQFNRGNAESVVLLGFADGAIRMSLITESRSIQPVQLIGYVDSVPQEVVTILAIPGTPLMDMLCFVGKNGDVAMWNDASLFHHLDGGFGHGPLTSAVFLAFDDGFDSTMSPTVRLNRRRGILATCQDGSAHLLSLAHDSCGMISVCERFPVRDEMASVTCCVSSQWSWLVFGILDGSAVFMRMDKSCFGKLQLWERETQSAGILDAVRRKPLEESDSRHARRLLCRLRSFEQMDGGISQGKNESTAQRETDIQRAMETTNIVLGLTNRRTNSVIVSGEGNSIVASLAVLPQPTSEQMETSSLHACFGTEMEASSRTVAVCRRQCHDGEGKVNVRYGGVAVTECKAARKDVEHRITTDDAKPSETFVSFAVEQDMRAMHLESAHAQLKRKKTANTAVESTVLCGRSEARECNDTIVIPL
jgi:hypothetical protein